jgi:hypothetical protein
MEEQKERISFRTDKKSEALSNVKVNKFGHTTTGSDNEPSESPVKLRSGGTSGVEAHVDIFDSPTMKQFMQQNNFDLESDEADVIDLSEETEEEVPVYSTREFARPESLEEFDLIADEMIGIKSPKKIFAQQPASDIKPCNSCGCKNKSNAKFCSNCGKPYLLAAFCKNCGSKFENQEKFCSECGSKRE